MKLSNIVLSLSVILSLAAFIQSQYMKPDIWCYTMTESQCLNHLRRARDYYNAIMNKNRTPRFKRSLILDALSNRELSLRYSIYNTNVLKAIDQRIKDFESRYIEMDNFLPFDIPKLG